MKTNTKRVFLILASFVMIQLSIAFIVFFPSDYTIISIANICLNVWNIYINAMAIEDSR